jgi:hypothetical protein
MAIILSIHVLHLLTHSQLLEGPKCESKEKTTEKQIIGAYSLVRSTLRGRRACWSFGMGLGRIDKLQLFTRTYTKPTWGGWCIIGAPLVLGWITCNMNTQDSPRPELGGEATTFPLIVYSVATHRAHIQMTFCLGTPKWESCNCPN